MVYCPAKGLFREYGINASQFTFQASEGAPRPGTASKSRSQLIECTLVYRYVYMYVSRPENHLSSVNVIISKPS